MMILPEFELLRPRSVDEAVAAARGANGAFDYLGGGTDLLCNYKWGINTNPTVISLRHIGELNERRNGSIGGGLTLAELEDDEDFLHDFPAFRRTLQRLASPLIRQTGTLAGNILVDTRCIWLNQTHFARKALGHCLKADGPECRVVKGSTDRSYANYSGDMAPEFMVLGADIRLAGPDGAAMPNPEHIFGAASVAAVTTPSVRAEEAFRARYDCDRLRPPGEWPLAVADDCGVAGGRIVDGDLERDLVVGG